MLNPLKIKESPTGIYLVAGLLVINGLMNLVINLSSSLDSVVIMGAGVLIASAFIVLALGILQHNFYAWALVTTGSGIGIVGFSWELLSSLIFLQSADNTLVIYLAYAALLTASAGIFYYMLLEKVRHLYNRK